MKKCKLLLFTILLSSMVYGQSGIKIGAGLSKIDIKNAETAFDFNGGDREIGYHIGLFTRLNMSIFYLQPEVIFTSSGGDIQVKKKNSSLLDKVPGGIFPNNELPESIPNASLSSLQTWHISYNKIDIPVMLGVKIKKWLRLQAGPVGSILLAATSENDKFAVALDIYDNYEKIVVGYQVGIGADIKNLLFIDLKFEGNLSRLGDEVQGFATDQRGNQLLLSLGINLQKVGGLFN